MARLRHFRSPVPTWGHIWPASIAKPPFSRTGFPADRPPDQGSAKTARSASGGRHRIRWSVWSHIGARLLMDEIRPGSPPPDLERLTDGSLKGWPHRSDTSPTLPRVLRTGPARRLGRVGVDPRRCRGRGRGAAPSRSPLSPHPTQNESPARPAVVLFWENPKNFKSKSGRQIGRKNGLVRRNRVQGIAKLDHPVSRESAAKNSGDRGLCKLGCTQTIKCGVPGRSGTGDDRPSQALRARMRKLKRKSL